jgi:hypothetical protein
MSKNIAPLPEWDRVLSSAARLQRILPDAVKIGTAQANELSPCLHRLESGFPTSQSSGAVVTGIQSIILVELEGLLKSKDYSSNSIKTYRDKFS